jgi:hypothetical protein
MIKHTICILEASRIYQTWNCIGTTTDCGRAALLAEGCPVQFELEKATTARWKTKWWPSKPIHLDDGLCEIYITQTYI